LRRSRYPLELRPSPAFKSKRDFLRTVTPALLTDGLRIEGGI
jgi:hypothetical protein